MSHDYVVMFCIMLVAGLLSTMNVWVDKWADMRVSINDVYMTLLMTGWMFLLTGLYYKEKHVGVVGICLVILNIWCIRTQFLVSSNQYIRGMIPHHSMAVHMSKQLLQQSVSPPTAVKAQEFAATIIKTQETEIDDMKHLLPV